LKGAKKKQGKSGRAQTFWLWENEWNNQRRRLRRMGGGGKRTVTDVLQKLAEFKKGNVRETPAKLGRETHLGTAAIWPKDKDVRPRLADFVRGTMVKKGETIWKVLSGQHTGRGRHRKWITLIERE